MIKYLHFFLFVLIYTIAVNAQPNNQISTSTSGFYQTVNLDNLTPCNCSEKTQRTYDLAKGLRPRDVKDYKLFAYKFSFGSSTIAASKLFKAMETDNSIYKVSMKEWDSFMLLTTDKFDYSSFEKAAAAVFETFSKISPEEFLKVKNIESYNEYMQEKEKHRIISEQAIRFQNGTK